MPLSTRLFISAMLGAAYGQGLAQVAPTVTGPAGAYALIGMGAVFAGAARAPITAMIIMFELTGESSHASAVPALDNTGENIVGWLTAQQVLRALRSDRPRPHHSPAPA